MPRNATAYDADYYAWTVEQARLLRAGELSAIDAENLAEEIEGMGISDRRELESRLIVLITHLLKWLHQPALRSRSWSLTIREQRLRIERVFADSPSLRPLAPATLPQVYEIARVRAAGETGFDEQTFPTECPFSLEQILSPEFLPE